MELEIGTRKGKAYLKNEQGKWVRPVMVGDQLYPSVGVLADLNGLSYSTTIHRVYKNLGLDGATLRFATEEEIREKFVPAGTISLKPSKRVKVKRGRGGGAAPKTPKIGSDGRRMGPVMVNGTVYPSRAAYRREAGVSKLKVARMEDSGELVPASMFEDPHSVQDVPELPKVVAGHPFEGVVWEDGSATIRLPHTKFSMTRPSLGDIPAELAELCLWK